MNFDNIELSLKRLSCSTGIIACALVAIDSGIIYSTTSTVKEFQMIAEGARDYWSLQYRNGKVYEILGDLNNIKICHKKGIICLQTCGTNTLLVALTKYNKVDWNNWANQTSQLTNMLDQYYGSLEQQV